MTRVLPRSARAAIPALLLCLIAAGPLVGQESRVVTADAKRFFEVVERARSSDDPVAVMQREYLDRGSPGLRYYHASGRLENAERLWRSVERYPRLYDAVRRFLEDIEARREAFEAPYAWFDALLDDAPTPPVYFVVGHFQGGATLFEGGLVIALDNWAADWGGFRDVDREFEPFDAVEVLQPIVAHELAHFHQSCWEDCGPVLAESIMEGSADFVAWRITGAETNWFNEPMYDYWREHEEALWPRFLADRGSTDLSPWLYDNDVDPLPANLGYAIGHSIARAYWETRGRTDEALREILAVRDYEAFLAASGYRPEG